MPCVGMRSKARWKAATAPPGWSSRLLSLSRLEAAQTSAMVSTDLQALARQVVAELVSKAIGKQHSLEFEGSEPFVLPGNETLLAVLVRNQRSAL